MASVFASVVVGADPALIEECVRSLTASSSPHNLSITVIVNKPTDSDRQPRVFTEGSKVHWAWNAVPAGFAANHNRAVASAESDYFLISNDDTVYLEDSVAKCIDFLERPENSDVASLSPRLLNTDGSLQRSTYGFPTVLRALLDLSGMRSLIPHNDATDRVASVISKNRGRSRFWAHDEVADVDTFRGAAMFVRKSAWDDVGPMCEIAQVGGEIAEWHKRCRDRGWRTVYFPLAEVIHHGGRTVGTDLLLKAEYVKGYRIYFERHATRARQIAFRVLGVSIAAVRFVSAAAIGGGSKALWARNVRILFLSSGWEKA